MQGQNLVKNMIKPNKAPYPIKSNKEISNGDSENLF